MTRIARTICLTLACSARLAMAQDGREALVRALMEAGAMRPIAAEQIVAPSASGCASGRWGIRGLRFDVVLRAWLVEAQCRKGAGVPVLAVVGVDDPRLFADAKNETAKRPVLVRAGERRMLTAEAPGMRITERVVCLRSGRAGDVIRVRSVGRSMIRRALISEHGDLVLVGGQ